MILQERGIASAGNNERGWARRMDRLLCVWLLAVLESVVLVLCAIWFLKHPVVFETYYPLLGVAQASWAPSLGNRAEDAAAIVNWLSGSDHVVELNGRLRHGTLIRKELKHYRDVRGWLDRVPLTVGVLCVAGCILAAGFAARQRWAWKSAIEAVAMVQWRALVFLAGLLLLGSMLAMLDWKLFFAWVHYPFFGESSWKLPRRSYSLQLFPAEFWRWMGVCVIAIPVLVITASGLLCRAYSGSGTKPIARNDASEVSEDASAAIGR